MASGTSTRAERRRIGRRDDVGQRPSSRANRRGSFLCTMAVDHQQTETHLDKLTLRCLSRLVFLRPSAESIASWEAGLTSQRLLMRSRASRQPSDPSICSRKLSIACCSNCSARQLLESPRAESYVVLDVCRDTFDGCDVAHADLSARSSEIGSTNCASARSWTNAICCC